MSDTESDARINRSQAILGAIVVSVLASVTIGTWAYVEGLGEYEAYVVGIVAYLFMVGVVTVFLNSPKRRWNNV